MKEMALKVQLQTFQVQKMVEKQSKQSTWLGPFDPKHRRKLYRK